MSVEANRNQSKEKIRITSGYNSKRDSRAGNHDLTINAHSPCESNKRYTSRSVKTAAQLSSRLAPKYTKQNHIEAACLNPSLSFGKSRETFAGPYQLMRSSQEGTLTSNDHNEHHTLDQNAESLWKCTRSIHKSQYWCQIDRTVAIGYLTTIARYVEQIKDLLSLN